MLKGPRAQRIQDRPWNPRAQAPEAWKGNALMLLVEFKESEVFWQDENRAEL